MLAKLQSGDFWPQNGKLEIFDETIQKWAENYQKHQNFSIYPRILEISTESVGSLLILV